MRQKKTAQLNALLKDSSDEEADIRTWVKGNKHQGQEEEEEDEIDDVQLSSGDEEDEGDEEEDEEAELSGSNEGE